MSLPQSIDEPAGADSCQQNARDIAATIGQPLQQAIFTSARTERSDGYHLVALSAGIDAQDARALTSWGPSHDSLQDDLIWPHSINFFGLPGGAYCLSKTFHYGMEHSLREGARCYTHCLIIDLSALALFGNHALSLFTWADAQRLFVPRETSEGGLPDMELPAERTWDAAEHKLADCVHDPRTAIVVDTLATVPGPLGLVGAADRESLLAAILDNLTCEDRLSVSFTTALRPSPRRPFRVTCLPEDLAVQRQARRMGMHLVDLNAC